MLYAVLIQMSYFGPGEVSVNKKVNKKDTRSLASGLYCIYLGKFDLLVLIVYAYELDVS